MLAEYIDGGLEPRERAQVEEHLADCGECYENFSETVRVVASTSKSTAGTAVLPKIRIVWLGIAAAAVLVLSGVTTVWWNSAGPAAERELQKIARANVTERPALGRLPEPFGWRPEPSATRGADRQELPLEIRSAALNLEALATASPSATTLHARGVALIAVGKPDEAIGAIEEALTLTRSAKEESVLRSDLSVAWLEKWRASNEPQDAAKALSQVEVALVRDNKNVTALFNRAMALTVLGLKDAAANAWKAYLNVDASSAWADEARTRLRGIEVSRGPWPTAGEFAAGNSTMFADAAARYPGALYDYIEDNVYPRWASEVASGSTRSVAQLHGIAGALKLHQREPATIARLSELISAETWPASRRSCLAEGLSQLYRAKQSWADARRTDSIAASASASRAFRCAGVSATAADASTAWAMFLIGQRDEALERFPSLIDAASREGLWRSEADLLRLRGLAAKDAARSDDANLDYRRALKLSERAGDETRAALLNANLSELAARDGDFQAAWRHIHSSFESLDHVPFVARYTITSGAVVAATQQGLAGASLSLSEAVKLATTGWTRSDGAIFCALQRGRASIAFGDSQGASHEIDKAAQMIEQIADSSLRNGWMTELNVIRAFVMISSLPADTNSESRKAIDKLMRENRPARVAEMLLLQGRALNQLGQTELAQRAWKEGIAVFEAQLAGAKTDSLRVLRTVSLWELFGELIDSTFADPVRSLQYVERSRARLMVGRLASVEANSATDLVDVRSSLVRGETALVYLVERGRLLRWIVTETVVTNSAHAIAESELRALVVAHRLELRDGGVGEASRTLGNLLLPSSLSASVQRLVFVPDGVLGSVSFAALPSPTSGRALIEDVTVVESPSMTVFSLASASEPMPAKAPSAALVAFAGPVPGAGLPALRSVDHEVAEIATMYARPQVLTGGAATPTRFFSLVQNADVVHIAAHGQVDYEAPSRSTIWLAPEETGTGAVTAEALSGLQLKRGATVILAACDTATGPSIRGQGTMNLAAPFLAGGAGTVIGTLWPIADRASVGTFQLLHENLLQTSDGSQALAVTQRALITRREPASVWASLVAVGGRKQPR